MDIRTACRTSLGFNERSNQITGADTFSVVQLNVEISWGFFKVDL